MGLEKNITWLLGSKNYNLTLLVAFLIWSGFCFSQKACTLKEIKVYKYMSDLGKKVKNPILMETRFYRGNNQLFRIEYYTEGETKGVMHYQYDSLNRCTMKYYEEKGVFLDTLKASFDNKGGIIPIREQTIREFAYPKSKYSKSKFNKCGDPVKIIKYQQPEGMIILKYCYKYKYW